MNSNKLGFAVACLAIVALVAVAVVFVHKPAQQDPNSSAAGFTVPVFTFATSSKLWIGSGNARDVASRSDGRSYLELTNLSGATTTPQTMYCAVGINATLYSGIVLFASSTRIWSSDLGPVPTGRVSCITTSGSTTIAVLEK